MGTHISRGGEVQAVLDGVRRIVHALRASSRRAEQEVGLSAAQLFVLQRLADAPALSINELAARTHTHQSSVSTVVAKLVEKGLVRRTAAADDARRVELSLAPRARRVVGRGPDVAQARLVEAIERLSAARRRQLAATLAELAQALDADARPPRMFFEDRSRTPRRAARLPA
jgi:DNA-binding MarR family transcriptional regulator